MKTVLIPPKFADEFREHVGRIEALEDEVLGARRDRDHAALERATREVAEACRALSRLQVKIWGDEIRAMLAIAGGAPVHSSYQTDPPAMVFYESDEEYEMALATEAAAAEAAGETFLHVDHRTVLPKEEP